MKSCTHCGEHFADQANFCPNCGRMLLANLSSSMGQAPATTSFVKHEASSKEGSTSLTYNEFRKRKESSRTTTLNAHPSKKVKSGKGDNSVQKVKIQVGIKFYCEDIPLKAMKGRTLPITVNSDIDAEGLLQEAVTKHAKHFRAFDGKLEYVLLYPDNTVVNFLPGSSDVFSLKKYKEDLGKPYSKIYLYLCTSECFQKAEVEFKENEGAEQVGGNVKSTDCEISSVVKNSQPIRPFLCNADIEPDVIIQLSTEERDGKVTCPSCYLDFPVNEIESHADICADRFDPVGIVSAVLEVQDDDEEGPEDHLLHGIIEHSEGNDNGIGVIEQIKGVISTLRPTIDLECSNRLSIRRRYAFQDYLAARRKPKRKFNPKAMLKITFIGEPAVDDGGPRREFFSGRPYTYKT